VVKLVSFFLSFSPFSANPRLLEPQQRLPAG
jgi:hypothetical protein